MLRWARARLLTWLPARLLACLRTNLLARLPARLVSSPFACVLAAAGVASLWPIAIARTGSVTIACRGPVTVDCSSPLTVACGGPFTVACTRAVAIGLEHLLAVLAAKILPRRLPGLDVGLGEFLAHVGVVVLHALTVICVVFPLPAIDVRDVDGPVGDDVDVAAAPVAAAPEGMANGDASCECDARGERSAGNVPYGGGK